MKKIKHDISWEGSTLKKTLRKPSHPEYAGKIISRVRSRTSEIIDLSDFIASMSPLVYKSMEGEYLIFNDALAELLGMERADLIGKTGEELYAPEIAELNSRADQGIISGRSVYEDYEIWIIIAWKKRFFRINKRPYVRLGQIQGITAVFSEITHKKEMEADLRRMILHDHMTGLLTRSAFEIRLAGAVQHAHRTNECIAVLFIDLDGFKEVNDTHGHDAGDQLLKEVATRMRASVREDDTVARIGGDEFAIFTPMKDMNNIWNITQKILKNIGKPILLNVSTLSESGWISRVVVKVGASIGVSIYDAPEITIDNKRKKWENLSDSEAEDLSNGLIRDADQAMYVAKRWGKDRVEFFKKENI